MALFDRFKKKSGLELAAHVKGTSVPISKVNDPTFADEILGKGVAVMPAEGKVYAPADGTISSVFHTMHAVTMVTDFGAEILIHIGLETVSLEGKYFNSHVKEGDTVKKGDLLIEFDKDKIIEEGYDMITPMVVCNSAEFKNIIANTDIEVQDDTIITMEKV